MVTPVSWADSVKYTICYHITHTPDEQTNFMYPPLLTIYNYNFCISKDGLVTTDTISIANKNLKIQAKCTKTLAVLLNYQWCLQ